MTNVVSGQYLSGEVFFRGFGSNVSAGLSPTRIYFKTNGGSYGLVISNTNAVVTWVTNFQTSNIYEAAVSNGTNVFTFAVVNVSNETNTVALTNVVENVMMMTVYGYSSGAAGVVDGRFLGVRPNTNVARYKRNITLRDFAVANISPAPTNGYWSVRLLETDRVEDTNFAYVFSFAETNLLRKVPWSAGGYIAFWDLPYYTNPGDVVTVFGNGYLVTNLTATFSMASTTFTNALTLPTTNLAQGDYMLSADYQYNFSSTGAQFTAKIYRVLASVTNTLMVATNTPTATSDWYNECFFYVDTVSNSPSYYLDIARVGALGTATTSSRSMQLFRVR